jgi:hypothetical protein
MWLGLRSNLVMLFRGNFTPLLESNHPLELVLDVEDTKSSVVGRLKVKAFWI